MPNWNKRSEYPGTIWEGRGGEGRGGEGRGGGGDLMRFKKDMAAFIPITMVTIQYMDAGEMGCNSSHALGQ